VDCYILNTGDFMGKKIQPAHTLGILEKIIENKAEFKKWENFSDIEIMRVDGFDASFRKEVYKDEFIKRMQDRIDFIKSRETQKAGLDKLPNDALEALQKVIEEA